MYHVFFNSPANTENEFSNFDVLNISAPSGGQIVTKQPLDGLKIGHVKWITGIDRPHA